MVQDTSVSPRILFDDETLAALASDWQQQLARMTFQERVCEFLGRCNHRGSRYRSDLDVYPNIRQIAKYCECDDTTILRIANGQTKAPSLRTLSIITAIACITPAAFECNASIEYRARIEDANRWVASDPTTRGDILKAIISGIDARIICRSASSN